MFDCLKNNFRRNYLPIPNTANSYKSSSTITRNDFTREEINHLKNILSIYENDTHVNIYGRNENALQTKANAASILINDIKSIKYFENFIDKAQKKSLKNLFNKSIADQIIEIISKIIEEDRKYLNDNSPDVLNGIVIKLKIIEKAECKILNIFKEYYSCYIFQSITKENKYKTENTFFKISSTLNKKEAQYYNVNKVQFELNSEIDLKNDLETIQAVLSEITRMIGGYYFSYTMMTEDEPEDKRLNAAVNKFMKYMNTLYKQIIEKINTNFPEYSSLYAFKNDFGYKIDRLIVDKAFLCKLIKALIDNRVKILNTSEALEQISTVALVSQKNKIL